MNAARSRQRQMKMAASERRDRPHCQIGGSAYQGAPHRNVSGSLQGGVHTRTREPAFRRSGAVGSSPDFPQPHARPFAVLGNEDHAGGFEGAGTEDPLFDGIPLVILIGAAVRVLNEGPAPLFERVRLAQAISLARNAIALCPFIPGLMARAVVGTFVVAERTVLRLRRSDAK